MPGIFKSPGMYELPNDPKLTLLTAAPLSIGCWQSGFGTADGVECGIIGYVVADELDDGLATPRVLSCDQTCS